ncbi:isochorismatase [Ktedonobacter sp. SOSP1-85]|uniref:cysteine hydrolase family protein n=1 Tax=Ktedonobacter sp. SOSP1-85 TaxID=2778367 RepID=UPI001914E4E9|nr:cysteine hydrolase family protein [Ktedonobacter sp. SOSP1-85]GHO73225.1 isochorismatase [Ktedonobacter sp. SOSP1-85]
MAAQTALLLIDVQNGLFDEAYEEEAAVLHILVELLERARNQQVPILYIQHGGGSGHPLEPGTPGWQIHPLVAPHSEDIIVHKSASDAFYESSLHDTLQSLGVTRLVVTGAQTEYCVDATCRRAASLNYDVYLVADGHTTSDNGKLTTAQIVAHHNHLLAQLAHPTHPIRVLPTTNITF